MSPDSFHMAVWRKLEKRRTDLDFSHKSCASCASKSRYQAIVGRDIQCLRYAKVMSSSVLVNAVKRHNFCIQSTTIIG
jgi:hypothetical protein